jgi:hypothetical protein
MTMNGGRGKKSHQLTNNNTSPEIICADVIKSGGINVQIVLGNSNLGHTILLTIWEERQGGVARRLGRKNEARETGAMGRGQDSLEIT